MEWFTNLTPNVQMTAIISTAFVAAWGSLMAALVALCRLPAEPEGHADEPGRVR